MNKGNLKFTQCYQILPQDGISIKGYSQIRITGEISNGFISIVFKKETTTQKIALGTKLIHDYPLKVDELLDISKDTDKINFEASSHVLNEICTANINFELLP